MNGELRPGDPAHEPTPPRQRAAGDASSNGTTGEQAGNAVGDPIRAATPGTAASSGPAAEPEPEPEPRDDESGELPLDPEIVLRSTTLTPWQQYVLLLRQLDAERSAEDDRTKNQRAAATAISAIADDLGPRLIDQGAELNQLAARLGLRRPRLSSVPPPEEVPPEELAEAAHDAAVRSEAAARLAADLGRRPAILPSWPARFRNAVIYLAWALIGLLAQYLFIQENRRGSAFVVLLIIPLLTFSCALFTVNSLGRVRLSPQATERSVRMGALICFGVFPVGFVYFFLRALMS